MEGFSFLCDPASLAAALSLRPGAGTSYKQSQLEFFLESLKLGHEKEACSASLVGKLPVVRPKLLVAMFLDCGGSQAVRMKLTDKWRKKTLEMERLWYCWDPWTWLS